MNDGDWICSEANCGNINFARRTSCYRCNAEKPEADNASKKKLGTEIGKSAAEKSRGLFNADDWQCNKCANVNWARRTTCNVCNAPKFGEVEARTGYGGGYNERGVVEYRRREGSSDDEYDEFGRKKRKQQRSETGDRVGITEGAEYKNLITKPQMELKVRNYMPAPATERNAITEQNKPKGRFNDGSVSGDSMHSIPSLRQNQDHYQTDAHKQNIKNMHSNKANSGFQSRQNRKRNTSTGDKDHTASSGYETAPKKTRKDSTDSPVFMSFNPVMENMVTSSNEVAYKFNGKTTSQNYAIKYTLKERVTAAAYAITYNNCKMSSERFQSLFDKPAPEFQKIFAWRQQLLATGCLDDAHSLTKSSCTPVKPVRVPNPDEIAIISSDSEEEGTTKSHLPKKPALQPRQRSDSVETVLLETVDKDTQGAKPFIETAEERGTNNKNNPAIKGTCSSSSDSRNSDSSETDSEPLERKSKTSTKSSRPKNTSARQSAIDSDSESISYHSDEENFLSRKFGENKKVKRKFKRRNAPIPPPATCSTPEKPVSYVPMTQPHTNTQPFQGYCTAKPMEKSPLMTGNIYTPNLRNMTAKTHKRPPGDVDNGSTEYVPTRLGATAKNNYQDFKNHVRLNGSGYWAKANGATLSTKRNSISQDVAPGLPQQNKSPIKGSISSYIPAVKQADKSLIETPKTLLIPGLGAHNKSPINKRGSSFIPGFGDLDTSPMKRVISSCISAFGELQKSSINRAISSFTPIEKPKNSVVSGFGNPDQFPIQKITTIPGLHESAPVKHKSSFIPGLESEKMPLQNYTSPSPAKSQTEQNSYSKGYTDFSQDDLDSSIATDHYLPFDRPKKVTLQIDQDLRCDQPPMQQKADQSLPQVDQIPLPETRYENTDCIFAVFKDNVGSKNGSIMDIFDSGLTEKSPERKKELEKYDNVKKPYVTEWDEDDDALYGESGNATEERNASPTPMKTNQSQSPAESMMNVDSQQDTMDRSSPNNLTDLLNERKEMLLGLLNNFQKNNESDQSPQKYNNNRAQQSSPNESFLTHALSNKETQFQKPVNNLTIMPEPIPQELSEELMRMSEDANNGEPPDKIISSPINIKDTKRIHIIESITIGPGTNQNLYSHNPELDLKPVTVISQPEMNTASENNSFSEKIEILESSDDQELPQVAASLPAAQSTADLSNLLAGIDANTLMLALKNLQQLAQNSHNSSFSSTHNNPEPEQQNPESASQAVDTINLTNDEWEKESVREGSIERQLEEMDGNPAATPFLSDIFDPGPVLQNVTRKLNINLKSPLDKTDAQKPDENAPVIGNFKSFALPKPPRLNRVKVPIKTSSKSSKRKGDGKRKRKKKKAAGSQDEAEGEEDEEESGDEADLAKYDLWGSEDESSKTGSSSKTGGSSKAGELHS
ncbi:putative zinc finger protein Ran-binding domain-containing protein [Operophtera brumata]|uniref:Putative zinc finger protein Ran-binding domain-containing protein n=1 Tax=Operophtera brumata TaxID=104452 RepID=A0A0L7LA94_OPEBR|nr:putative zinc finger protein Ran-binding domain-containing protein [Operophtera brumata]